MGSVIELSVLDGDNVLRKLATCHVTIHRERDADEWRDDREGRKVDDEKEDVLIAGIGRGDETAGRRELRVDDRVTRLAARQHLLAHHVEDLKSKRVEIMETSLCYRKGS